MDDLGPLLDKAAVLNLDVRVAIYGTSTLTHPHTYGMNECGASARLRLSGRRVAVVVADDDHTLVASFGDRTPDEAVLTTNPRNQFAGRRVHQGGYFRSSHDQRHNSAGPSRLVEDSEHARDACACRIMGLPLSHCF